MRRARTQELEDSRENILMPAHSVLHAFYYGMKSYRAFLRLPRHCVVSIADCVSWVHMVLP